MIPTELPFKDLELLRKQANALNLWGVLANWEKVCTQPWLSILLEYEEQERKRRSLERRIQSSRIGAFKTITDFDWSHPRKIDREGIEEMFSSTFIKEGSNAVFLGPNGVGKTMLLKNIAYHALLQGFTVRFTTASEMLSELAAQDSSSSLSRRLLQFCTPQLLCIDEVGYLSYDNRYADLLFEVVTRRYQAPKSIVLSTNKLFGEWPSVFPNAACVVTLVDRLLHRCEQFQIDADSYRLKEAAERQAVKAKERVQRKRKARQIANQSAAEEKP
jgi:DNA replication protein DnaC